MEKKWWVSLTLVFCVLSAFVGVQVADRPFVAEKVIYIGDPAYAAGTLDYTYDGVADDVQFQAALNALPATGGRLVVVSTTQINFTATVTRAIDNVIIEGSGRSTYFVQDGITPIFTAGGNNWKFVNIRTDAGSINMAATTGWEWNNVTIGTTFYAHRVDDAVVATSVELPQGATGATAKLIASNANAFERAYGTVAHIFMDDYVQVVSGTYDDEMQSALDLIQPTGGSVELSEGLFTQSAATITYEGDNLTIYGQGDATIIDASAVTTTALKIFGEITTTNSTLTVDADEGQKDATVANGALFAVGDWVRLRSEDAFDAGTTNIGEIQQIDGIAGNVLTMVLPLSDTYEVADTGTVDLVTLRMNITLRDFKMVGASSSKNQYAMELDQVHDVRIENLTIEDFWDRSIYIKDVVDVDITNCNIRGSNRANLGYGVCLANVTQRASVRGNHFEDCRHAFTHSYTGGNYGIGRDIIVDGNTAVGGLTNTVGQFNTHNTCEHVIFSNNTVTGDMGFSLGAPHTTVIGNYIYTQPNEHGIIIGDVNHDIDIIGNHILHGNQGVNVGYGTISNLNISNNYFGVSSTTGNIWHTVIGYCGSSSVKIEGNTFHDAAHGIFLILNNGSGTASDFVISDNQFEGGTNYAIRIGYTSIAGNLTGILIANNYIDANTKDGIYIEDDASGAKLVDHIVITGNIIKNAADGIDIDDYANNIQITNNHIISCTNPYSINFNAASVSLCMIMGNYWNGCTNDGTAAGAAATFRVTSNIDKTGAWEAGDDPG